MRFLCALDAVSEAPLEVVGCDGLQGPEPATTLVLETARSLAEEFFGCAIRRSVESTEAACPFAYSW